MNIELHGFSPEKIGEMTMDIMHGLLHAGRCHESIIDARVTVIPSRSFTHVRERPFFRVFIQDESLFEIVLDTLKDVKKRAVKGKVRVEWVRLSQRSNI